MHGPQPPDQHDPWWAATTSASFGPIDRYRPPKLAPDEVQPGCGFVLSRDLLQDKLTELNPDWERWAHRLRTEPKETFRRNPDGDIQLEGVAYETFKYPSCPECGGVLKPDVTFFGENVRPSIRQGAEDMVNDCDAVLVVGSTLATHSAFRLVRTAREEGKPGMLLNDGPTRADAIVDTRIGVDCSNVLRDVEQQLSSMGAM